MNYDWILHPLTTYGTLAAGLILALYLFWTVKRETGALGRQASLRAEGFERARSEMERQLGELEAYVKDAQGSGVAMPAQQLNLTRRAKALRMHRRGESAASIAAALGAPRNEVDLLIKIQQLLVCRS